MGQNTQTVAIAHKPPVSRWRCAVRETQPALVARQGRRAYYEVIVLPDDPGGFHLEEVLTVDLDDHEGFLLLVETPHSTLTGSTYAVVELGFEDSELDPKVCKRVVGTVVGSCRAYVERDVNPVDQILRRARLAWLAWRKAHPCVEWGSYDDADADELVRIETTLVPGTLASLVEYITDERVRYGVSEYPTASPLECIQNMVKHLISQEIEAVERGLQVRQEAAA